MKLRYSREALAQIAEITEQLEAEDQSAARRFISRVRSLTARLRLYPGIGRPTEIPRLHVVPTRPFPFLMFYVVDEDQVTILKIRHMSRNEDWRAGR